MAILRLDHVAVAVADPAPAARLWGELLGGRYVQGVPDYNGFSFLQFEYPNGSRVEIISPASDPKGFVRKFLERRGEGLHHLTYVVDDLRAEVERFRVEGCRVVDEEYADPTWYEAFLSPRTAHGTLIQLVQSTLSQEEQDRLWGARPLARVLELAAEQR